MAKSLLLLIFAILTISTTVRRFEKKAAWGTGPFERDAIGFYFRLLL
jgi:hypothetical protein